MAKRKHSKNKKIQPAPTRMWFRIDCDNTSNYIDISLAASAMNRRFYRQGTNWAVAGMTLHTQNTTGIVEVSKVPDTWMARNSHTKAKELWFKANDQVLDDEPSIKAKYNDFKISLDSDMVRNTIQSGNDAAADGEIMMPVDSGDAVTKYGEWVYSVFQIPDQGGSNPPIEKGLHMVGPDDTDSFGLITGYGLSRSRPQLLDPNVPTLGGWMNTVFDVADNLDDIREDLTEDNDVPPYRVGSDMDVDPSLEYYPGGVNNVPSAALHSLTYITSTTVGGKTPIEGGTFGCGLIRFDWDLNTDTEDMYLAVDLVPGNYKGYLTEVY